MLNTGQVRAAAKDALSQGNEALVTHMNTRKLVQELADQDPDNIQPDKPFHRGFTTKPQFGHAKGIKPWQGKRGHLDLPADELYKDEFAKLDVPDSLDDLDMTPDPTKVPKLPYSDRLSLDFPPEPDQL